MEDSHNGSQHPSPLCRRFSSTLSPAPAFTATSWIWHICAIISLLINVPTCHACQVDGLQRTGAYRCGVGQKCVISQCRRRRRRLWCCTKPWLWAPLIASFLSKNATAAESEIIEFDGTNEILLPMKLVVWKWRESKPTRQNVKMSSLKFFTKMYPVQEKCRQKHHICPHDMILEWKQEFPSIHKPRRKELPL